MRVKGNKLVRSRPATRLVATLAMLAAAGAAAAQDLPQPRNHVDDRARVINDSAETQIIAVLAELEQKTGAQVIVLTIDTTGGAPIEDYALRTAERWKLGQKGKDNGVLVVVAVKDKQYRIEVGSGLEGRLPDGFVGSIGRKYFRPYFQRGDYSTGIQQGTLALVGAIAKEYNVTIAGAAAAGPTPGEQTPQTLNDAPVVVRTLLQACGLSPFVIVILIIHVLRSRMGRHRRWGGGSSSWLLWMLLGSMMGGGRRHGGGGGWGGGGFGGGGFGGGSFGGGGGGGFGGGGASGGW